MGAGVSIIFIAEDSSTNTKSLRLLQAFSYCCERTLAKQVDTRLVQPVRLDMLNLILLVLCNGVKRFAKSKQFIYLRFDLAYDLFANLACLLHLEL